MSLQNELKVALKFFLDEGDDSDLLEIIKEYSGIISTKCGNYPDLHRIVDICIGPKCYRVLRQISENEELTLSPIDTISDVPGVPLWLTGKKLKEWAKLEEDEPSQDSIDWDSYR